MKILVMALLMQLTLTRSTGTMVKAEKMTPSEIVELQQADEKVNAAERYRDGVRGKVAGQHKMANLSMDYQNWYEFDGDYIIQRQDKRSLVTW